MGMDRLDLSQVNWDMVLPRIGIGTEYLSSKHGPCPMCGGKDRFRFANRKGDGTWFCSACPPNAGKNVASGNGIGLVARYRGVSFGEAAAIIRNEGLGLPPPPVRVYAQKVPPQKVRESLSRTWNEALPIVVGDPVWTYLNKRVPRLRCVPVQSVLRYHPGLPYYEHVGKKPDGTPLYKKRGVWPVMLAKLSSSDGTKALTLHRTYLSMDGHKAPFEKVKKLSCELGEKGGSIRLRTPVGRVIGYTEGIETALGVDVLIKGAFPVWASYSSGLLAQVVPPPGVEIVHLYVDHDHEKNGYRAGMGAGIKAKKRLEQMGYQVYIHLPPNEGMDWLDVLVTVNEQS